jgi:phage terminase Nu1 subunit (DNA packaging protein)
MAPLQSEIAAALGVTPAVVTRLKARGMPVHDIEAARVWRMQHVRARVTAPPPAGAPAVPPAAAPTGARDSDGDDGYWHSRSRREAAEAELAELKLAEQRGDLVRAADVRAAYAKRAAGLREALLQIPARLASVLAAETDHARVHDTLQAELHAVLSQMVQA